MSHDIPKILAVDDKPANLLAMKKILASVDAHIITAESGNEALSLTLKHEFALIVLDVKMPDMDGYEVARILRGDANTENIPIIFITANLVNDENIFKGYEAGAIDYLTKPIIEPILISKVSVFLKLYTYNKKLIEIQESKYQELFNALADMIIICTLDNDGNVPKILEVNKVTTEILGYSREKLFSMNFCDLINCDTRDHIIANINSLMHNHKNKFEAMFTTKSGETLLFELNSHVVTIDGKRHIISIARDISERKLKEEYLEKSRDYYLTLFDNSPAMIWRSDKDQHYNYFNKKIIAFTGKSMEELMNKGWAECIHDDDFNRYSETFHNSFTLKKSFVMEYRIPGSSGEYRWIVDYGIPYNDIDNNFAGYIGYCFDITELKKTEKTLIKAKKKAEEETLAKNLFMTNISHELRTPLTGIIGMCRLLLKTPLNETQKKYLDLLNISSSNLHQLINDLLDFSMIESGKLKIKHKPVDLRELVVKTVESLKITAAEKKLDLNYAINGYDNYIIEADYLRLHQILYNLITNSIKYTNSGSINVCMDVTEQTDNEINVVFKVIDTGIGIDKDDINKIFEQFTQLENPYTKKQSGVGIGLPLVKSLIMMMEGGISVESAPGQGSTFSFNLRFPLSADLTMVSEVKLPEVNKDTSRKTHVLIVEDEVINMFYIKEILVNNEYNVTTARNGKEALVAFNEQVFDIVLMDVNMPQMNGIEATKAMRNSEMNSGNNSAIIIGLSAYTQENDVKNFIDAGMNDYIPKPINEYMLLEKLNAYSEKSELK